MSDIEKIKSVLRYEPDTGLFYWKVDLNSRAMTGRVAGHIRKRCGYVKLMVFNKYYAAHRLAWLFVYGYLPDYIDHKDRNRSNNAISNLRECTPSQNAMNRIVSTKNTSGHQGVVWNKARGKWQAQASINGKHRYLGIFDSQADAAGAYDQFCRENHGEFYLSHCKEASNG